MCWAITERGFKSTYDLEPDAIDIKMGTLSKTLAGSGGFVAGREELITYLRHHARGYIFSGALPACQASVSIAALEVLERKPELVEQLWENVDRYLSGLKAMGFDTAGCETPIVPVMTENDQITLEMTQICRSQGLLVVPVCFPAVPMDAPRLRTCVSAVHTQRRHRLRPGCAATCRSADQLDPVTAVISPDPAEWQIQEGQRIQRLLTGELEFRDPTDIDTGRDSESIIRSGRREVEAPGYPRTIGPPGPLPSVGKTVSLPFPFPFDRCGDDPGRVCFDHV